ncbi:helix-turn-helix domain-containing protein [Treponema pedis]|uniref:Helix-turn-helix transcriptional regulator n=2 Tax=Treponema pedis TaxID=409322 RepID=A0A7S6WNJ2_9SPIR|nr:AraC family transcriptional regulator [Treponema pedis]QOW60428.1 helix-turn-helix transcriptional regulator [Treponema pedis]QSI05765.1 AraC family transcriptional regulator [Treponema pedis]
MAYFPFKYEASDIFPRRMLAVRPGLHIAASAGVCTDKTKRETAALSPLFELSYTRKGTVCGEVGHTLVEVRPGNAALGFMNSVSCRSEYKSGEDVQLYSIWASPRVFDGLCEAVGGKSGIGFQDFRNRDYSCRSFTMDMQEEYILGKLDRCFSGGRDTINRLLVESCVLELLSVNLERLLFDGCVNRAGGLSKTETDSLKQAREILLHRLESPPTLLELSRLVHLNDCRLKKAFKLFFGKTVYEYVREQRLEKAFHLIESGTCNVSEAACAVGYTNISHFSEAFRKKYRVLPKTVKKKAAEVTPDCFLSNDNTIENKRLCALVI